MARLLSRSANRPRKRTECRASLRHCSSGNPVLVRARSPCQLAPPQAFVPRKPEFLSQLMTARCWPTASRTSSGKTFQLHWQADRAETPRTCSQNNVDLTLIGRVNRCRAEDSCQFGLVQLVIATEQHYDRLAISDINQCLDLAVCGDAVRRLRQRIDRDNSRRGKLSRAGSRPPGQPCWEYRSWPSRCWPRSCTLRNRPLHSPPVSAGTMNSCE